MQCLRRAQDATLSLLLEAAADPMTRRRMPTDVPYVPLVIFLAKLLSGNSGSGFWFCGARGGAAAVARRLQKRVLSVCLMFSPNTGAMLSTSRKYQSRTPSAVVIEPGFRRQSLQNGNNRGCGRRLSPIGALRLQIRECRDRVARAKRPAFSGPFSRFPGSHLSSNSLPKLTGKAL
jgi:hypothetical protein